MPTRRNPPSGDAQFDTLTCKALFAGFDGSEPLPNATHQLNGLTTVTGAPDTIVLDVAEHARIRGLLSAERLEVGLTTAPDPGPYDDPYPGSPYEGEPYPDVGSGGGENPPEQTGFSVDEAGNVRTSGFVVVKHAPGGIVLRSPGGVYYSFAVDAGGNLATQGQILGTTPP